jgi:hypothetical protein
MTLLRYTILILMITFFSLIGKSQIIISADSFSCVFFLEKNGIKDTFLITLKPSSVDLVNIKDTNFYNIDTFKERLAKILSWETANVLDNFYSLDSAKLLGIKGNIKGKTNFLYSIKQVSSHPTPPIPAPSNAEGNTGGLDKKWYVLLLITPLILILIFRKKIGPLLLPNDKKVAQQTESHHENDAAPVHYINKVHTIQNHEMDTTNISESDLKKENKSSEKEIKELIKLGNEHNNEIKKYKDYIDGLKKTIESKDESIKNHRTELVAEIAKQKEHYENLLKNEHENTLNKYKQDLNNQNKKHEEKLLAIVAENKQLDKVVSKIYEKYQFLNDVRKYDSSFDLGQIIEAAYFLNSATKNYVLKLPELFKLRSDDKFTSQGILSISDKANLDYLLTSNIADNVLVADEDSVKRNQDLSRYIRILRKKLVEAKVNDVSNVIIENHRINL